jgi:drug/metabolite transporter (DMT)-like permease
MKWKEDPRWAYVFVNLSCVMWAGNFVLARSLREEIGPLMLTISRFVVASLFYAVILGRSAVRERLLLKDWALLAAMTLTGVLGFPLLLYQGLQFTTATNAVLINATSPLMTAGLAAILIKERLFPRHVLGGIITFFGVALIVSGGSFERLQRWHINVGDLYVLLAAGLWGLYSVISRWATRSHSVFSVTAISTWMALPLFLGAAAVGWEPAPTNWNWYLVLAVVYIGIFPSGVAFLSWNEGVRRVGANRAMVFYNMLPVYGAILGVILLGESLGAQHFIGGGLILAGSLMAIWPELRTAAGKGVR